MAQVRERWPQGSNPWDRPHSHPLPTQNSSSSEQSPHSNAVPPLSSSSNHPSPASGSITTYQATPAVPARPWDRGSESPYGSYGGGYGSSYNSYGGGYGGYSGYNTGAGYRYGGSYDNSGYGGYGNGYGYANNNQQPPDLKPPAVIQSGFHWLRDLYGLVDSVSRFSHVLEANHMAVHGSFMSMMAVFARFSELGRMFSYGLQTFTFYKLVRRFIGGSAQGPDFNVAAFNEFQRSPSSNGGSRRGWLFIAGMVCLGIFGPILLARLLRLGRRNNDRLEDTKPTNQPTETTTEKAKALYSYEAMSANELSFMKDEVIAIKKKPFPEWWEGQVGDRVGLFPSNFVEQLPATPPPRVCTDA